MNIDLIPNQAINRVHVSQNDIGRTLTFNLFNESLAYTVPIGATVKIQGTKPSGFGFSETCTVSGNTVTVDTTEEMTDEFGYIETELQITNSGDVLGTSNFVLVVEKNPHPDNTTDGTQITAQSLEVRIEALEESALGGLTDDIKQALLNCFAHVAWIDEHGQDYYDALESALYPTGTLTSISCVYTQTKTVYLNSSLNDLKSDLVVTGHFSDGSTAGVLTYTLSGTLTSGTSTITVEYGGFTTTFTTVVTNDYALPTGYTRYDYVKNKTYSSGSGIDVDTGLGYQYGATNYQHEFDMAWESGTSTTTGSVWGVRQQTGTATNALGLWFKYVESDGNIAINYMGESSLYATRIEQDTFYSFVYCVENGEGHVYKNDILDFTVASPIALTSAVTGTIRLFGMRRNNTTDISGHIHRIYRYAVYNNTTGEYVAYMLPCTNSNGVAGFYDVIRNNFYTASTSSNVECGNDV